MTTAAEYAKKARATIAHAERLREEGVRPDVSREHSATALRSADIAASWAAAYAALALLGDET